MTTDTGIQGSSPRMRGSPLISPCIRVGQGIIPAHAGLTRLLISTLCRMRDHPRACGAHDRRWTLEQSRQGSSPRMRGSRWLPCGFRCRLGIIPAHAGLTRARC